ncbi:MAG: hypothetical protein ACR2LQ_04735 [Acidimicrobiales bacterium]
MIGAVLASDSGWPYIVGGYTATLGGLGAYAVWVLLRGRRLSKQVPPEDRRWM